MNKVEYLDYEGILEVYEKTIESSDGGFSGVRDEGGIRAVLQFIQDDEYYPTFGDKLTHLTYTICTGHYFNDGNKRVALTAGMWFLLRNGKTWQAATFMRTFEYIMYHVAEGKIKKDLYSRGIAFFMDNQEPDESYKLDLADAIADNGSVHKVGDLTYG